MSEESGVFEPESLSAVTTGAKDSIAKTVDSQRGGVVSVRGTGEGLVIRLDGRVEPESLKAALQEYVGSRKSFLQGTAVSLEWVGAKPANKVVEEILSLLAKEFEIEVRINRLRSDEAAASRATLSSGVTKSDYESLSPESLSPESLSPESLSPGSSSPGSSRGQKSEGKSVSLFDGIESLGLGHEVERATAVSNATGLAAGLTTGRASGLTTGRASGLTTDASGALWDDPDARIVYSTLRSGQRVETEHSLVVIGDINSGAEIVAGGDIVVLGTLRGVAHAGAFDETGGGRVIVALTMAPTQLRIGSVISRGSGEGHRSTEVARVDGNVIVVEPYQPRNLRGHLFRGPRRS